jgi:hypothetical protein
MRSHVGLTLVQLKPCELLEHREVSKTTTLLRNVKRDG